MYNGYDYYNYNDPAKGNKHIYAFGTRYESIKSCGFIHADNLTQARATLKAHNNAWQDYNNYLLDYSEDECITEIARREKEYASKVQQ